MTHVTQNPFWAKCRESRVIKGTQGTCSRSAVSLGRDSCAETKTGMCPLHRCDGCDVGQYSADRWHEQEHLAKTSPESVRLNMYRRLEVYCAEQGILSSGESSFMGQSLSKPQFSHLKKRLARPLLGLVCTSSFFFFFLTALGVC